MSPAFWKTMFVYGAILLGTGVLEILTGIRGEIGAGLAGIALYRTFAADSERAEAARPSTPEARNG